MALYQRKLERDLLPLHTPPPVPHPADYRVLVAAPKATEPTPWELERRRGRHPTTPPVPTPHSPNAGGAVAPRAEEDWSPSTSRRLVISPGRYVPPVGTPRVDTGLRRTPSRTANEQDSRVSMGSRSTPTARERVLIEEDVVRTRRRSPSPAFRSTSPRFGIQHRFSLEPTLFDRGSYLRPKISASHDFYVPPGMADEVRRSRSPGRVVMRSTTPRFVKMIPHGSGMVCPVLTAGERVHGHMPS
jgi:hypothetical protein